MSSTQTVQGVRQIGSAASAVNALDFMVTRKIITSINTAIPVLIKAVEAGGASGAAGYVDAMPLVCQVDATGKTLQPTTLFHLPYFRLQAGNAGVVIDPVAGDIGLAVFAQADCSALPQDTTQAVQPGSWRRFDQADGFYIGGFLNAKPATVYIEMTQAGRVNIVAPGGVEITGAVHSTGDITAGTVSLKSHVHSGVESGGSNTGGPVA